jgi:hypothetical protein
MMRKKMIMMTTMTELREVDLEEMACVDGGYDEGGWCGFHPPGWHPPGLGS